MGLGGVIRNALWNRGSRAAAVHEAPIFESLEPRLLLSADGLATTQLDPLNNYSDLAPAIEVDIGYGLAQPATDIEATQRQETVSEHTELVVDDSRDGSNEVPGDSDTSLTTLKNTGVELAKVVAIEVAKDSTSDQAVPNNSLVSDQKSPSCDSVVIKDQTMGSIDPRGPPVASVSLLGSLESLTHDQLDELSYSPNVVGSTTNSDSDSDISMCLRFDGTAIAAVGESLLTDAQVNSLLEQALQNWATSPLPPQQLERLSAITVEIADLPGGILGETRGYSILVDAEAAGYSWFVDTTPGENSEFSQTGSTHLSAIVGSDAYDNIDLLTVLTHEVGHVLGFEHDASLAVMADVLQVGQRVLLLDEQLLVSDQAGELPVALASHAPPTLDLSAETADLTITLSDNSGAFDVTVTGATVNTGDNGTFSGIETIIGGSGTDTLIGPNVVNNWTINGKNAGEIRSVLTGPTTDTVNFSEIENIQGGTDADLILFDGGGVSGTITDPSIIDINIGGFVTISGTFTYSSQTITTLNLSGGSTPTYSNASMITIGATSGTVFVGSNGGTTDETGFKATMESGDSFAAAIITHNNGTPARPSANSTCRDS